MKIITVVGARPQFIKLATVSRNLRGQNDVSEIILHTGQHYDPDMSDIFFNELDIPKPKYNLGIGGGTHGQNTGRMLEAIESVLLKEKPDKVLVYGDTDSTLAGSLAAAKLNIPVAHVEAGLRSFNRKMPEEINRILTDHISAILFTPTDAATNNLLNENISKDMIQQVGDVMFDAAMFYKHRSKCPSEIDDCTKKFVLSTIHRAENTDSPNRLGEIIEALTNIAEDIPVILPIHPRTRKILEAGKYKTGKIKLLDPVGYLEMIWLLSNCEMVVTDSGGLQKEAYFFGKPCITTRDETEWVELTECGVNVLVGSNKELIYSTFNSIQSINVSKISFYGDANAGELIAKKLSN